jgi:Thioredoxin
MNELHSSTSMPSTFLRAGYYHRWDGLTECTQLDADSWCGPCKVLSPILEKLAGDANTKTGSGRPIDLITVDADEHGALAQKYSVRVAMLVIISIHLTESARC